MMTEGQLPGANIGKYLAYTVMIFEFASRYDWQSVLDFDIRYREQQAQHNFHWGTAAIHLAYSLRPVAKQQGQTRILGSSKDVNWDRLAEGGRTTMVRETKSAAFMLRGVTAPMAKSANFATLQGTDMRQAPVLAVCSSWRLGIVTCDNRIRTGILF